MNWLQRWALRKVVGRMGAWVQKALQGGLGWKTLLAAAVILASLVVQGAGHPQQAESLLRLGEALGLVGLRDALSKLPK